MWIVYHKPGNPSDTWRIKRIADTVSMKTGAQVEAITIHEYIKHPREGLVIPLLLYRGGHYCDIESKTREAGGILAGIVPLELTVKAIMEIARQNKCTTIRLLVHKPKRCINLFERDLNNIQSLLSRQGISLSDGTREHDCDIPLTLLPSRHLGAGKEKVNTGLLTYIEEGLTRWITSTILGNTSYLKGPSEGIL